MQILEKTWKLRKPEVNDGKSVWQLVRDSNTLDVNSAYCYILLCDQYRDTCVLAEQDGEIIGFVSSFRKQSDPDTLFIWQIVVSADHQGKGLARHMLRELLDQQQGEPLRHIQLTISPSNQSSQSLFRKWAEELDVPIREYDGYGADLFPGNDHEDERLYQIGPLATTNS